MADWCDQCNAEVRNWSSGPKVHGSRDFRYGEPLEDLIWEQG